MVEAASHINPYAEARTAGRMPQATAGAAGEGAGFIDFLKGLVDIINPLQHIPVVSTFYRKLTGDEISPMARIAGGTLYGGPLGAGAAVADVAFAGSSGKDIGSTMLAMFDGKEESGGKTASVQLAALSEKDIIWNDAPVMAASSATELARIEAAAGSPSSPPINSHRTGQGTDPKGTSPGYRSLHDDRLAPPTGNAVAAASAPETPIRQAARRNEIPSPAPAGLSAVLLTQNAPADTARTAVPPERIATSSPPAEGGLVSLKMMEALDKYAAMKGGLGTPLRVDAAY